MNILRKLLGAAPTPADNGAFSPSPLALKLATSSTTDYDGDDYIAGALARPDEGDKPRILMVCTEESDMVMANGKKFSTGNHPVEMALPMLHLLNAGFAIDVATPTGKPVKIEMWAMPDDDKNVKNLFADYADAFENPLSLADCVAGSMADDTPWAAVFIPGGHGAMLGLPDNEDMGKLLRQANDQGLYTLALCHGPAALLAADDGTGFIYDGYEIAAFPDSVDKQTPMIGYMPGQVPWKFGEKLSEKGITIINTKADNTCHIDRHLITGASPKAANDFGKLAAATLLEATDAK